MKGDLRCIDGRLFRHDPQFDDPDLETDVGECPDCSGDGCGDCGEAVSKPGRSLEWMERMQTMTAPLPPLTEADIAGIAECHANTTPGEWRADLDQVTVRAFGGAAIGEPIVWSSHGKGRNRQIVDDDLLFIATAHQDIPRLIADLRRCREALVGIEKFRSRLGYAADTGAFAKVRRALGTEE